MRRIFSFLVLGFAVCAARAQSVHWEGAPEDPSEVQLIFEECSPEGDPRLPAMADYALTLTGNSSQTSIINGSFSRSQILTYSVRSKRAGAVLQIPAMTVQTSKGAKPVAAFTGGAARVISDATVNARLTPASTELWVGEVVPLTYVIDAARRSFSQLASPIDWNAAPLVAEEWSKPEPSEVTVDGESRINITYRARAYAKSPGTLALNPATQLVNIATGSIGFGLFQQQRVEQLSVTSKRAELTVKPLPSPAPAGFAGAVGQFKLISKVVPNVAGIGEPVTWTIELSGTGNWPDIAGLPQREVSKDFQIVQPQAKRTPIEGKLFDVTLSEDVVLVPTAVGSYALNPVSFVYFDPKAGQYKTLSTARTIVTITPAANTTAATPRIQIGAAEPTAPSPAGSVAPKSTVAAAPLPAIIPRGPLPGAEHSAVPLARRDFLLILAIPPVVLVLFWAWLALRRAKLTDPARTRREARARLAATLTRLRTAGPAERPALLLAWQHDAALLWEISHAAPPPASLGDKAWQQLWSDADRTLYRADTSLPSDWIARAEAATVLKRVPRFSPLTAFRPRNFAPFLAVLIVTVLLPSLGGVDATAAYNKGDFATAEKSWMGEVTHDPANPIARHNLSLALAQQDRWDLALAHATAALVQSPASEPIRWQFVLASERAGFLPTPLAAFPKPGPLQALAQLASPGIWQRFLVAAAILCALALAILLHGAYRSSSTVRKGLALGGLGLSVLLAIAALLGIHAYGQAADARAVIIWRGSLLRSIPTEADTTQKSTTLAAGSVAVVDRAFLGWVRLSFDNGQTGWVRKEDTVSLWQ